MKNKKTELDNIDLEIFQELQKNARVSSNELSHKLNISSTTIRRRMRMLLEDDTIRIVAIGDVRKIGFNTMAGIRLEIELKETQRVTRELAQYKEMQSIAITTGKFNISTLAIFANVQEFHDFMQNVISKIDGLISVETMVFMDIVKGRFIWGAE
jgi:DNA-binding Lrp family transcriptional regulator